MTSLLLAHAQVASEEPVFNAVIQWVKHGDAARAEHLAPLLRHVRLPLLSAKYITDVADDEVRTAQLMTLDDERNPNLFSLLVWLNKF